MRSLSIGSFIIFLVIAFSLKEADLKIFLNLHSIVLVFLGSIGIFSLSTPGKDITLLFSYLKNIRSSTQSFRDYTESLNAIAKQKNAPTSKKHPLIEYAQELWEKGVDAKIFSALLFERAEELSGVTEQAVAALRNLSKYPPALGMTGTVIGLVSLFSKLDPSNRQTIGPNLALAMTATFYGLILANMILMPLADRLSVIHLGNIKLNQQVLKVLMLIHEGEAALVKDETHELP